MIKQVFRMNIYARLMNKLVFWMNCVFLVVICEYQ